ncbi:Asp23/Gls24 family envelope stress response protein [Schleiferilactobacillus shenzhenensis]|nr:Asp23/Gls24 family envelope stress response protein [Schleiferilactobacillus shenzhenensis]
MTTMTMDNKLDSKKIPQVNKELSFNDNVVAKVAAHAASDIEGVLDLKGSMMDNMTNMFTSSDTRGVNVDVSDDQEVAVSFEAILEYGKSAPVIFDRVVNTVCKTIPELTGLKVTEVKMNVKDMVTREEWNEQNKKDDDNK